MHYVYLLRSKVKDEIYIACTQDLRLRFSQHNAGKSFSTKNGVPWELIYYEAFKEKEDAIVREKMLKYDGRARVWLKKRLKKSLQ